MQNNPAIEAAVAPLREEAIAAAYRSTNSQILRAYDKLAAAGWDLNAVAEYPSSNMDRVRYRAAQALRLFYENITTEDAARNVDATGFRVYYRSRGGAWYVKACEKGATSVIARAKQAAAESFELYVAKLSDKIGDAAEARLENVAGVWGLSFLHVVLASGDKQVWKTTQIVNCSVYGKLFNQWPTRKVG